MTNKRSNFLVHWTGKGICNDPTQLTEEKKERYVERLNSILQKGFWMKEPNTPELLKGRNGSNIPLGHNCFTSFTEIKLSSAHSFAQKYGLLGVAVNRTFVLDRLGLPVHYVRNTDHEAYVQNLLQVGNFLDKLATFADDPLGKEAELHLRYLTLNACFLKAMSSSEDTFDLLNEHEWRIVHTLRTEAEGQIRTNPDQEPPYLLPLNDGDVKIIIFPDGTTKSMALADKNLKAGMRALFIARSYLYLKNVPTFN